MSLCRDKQFKGFLLFLCLFALLFVGTGTVLAIHQVNDMEILWLTHDEAIVSSLLEQGVSKETIVTALMNTEISGDGRSLLAAAVWENKQRSVCALFSINFSNLLSA